MTKPKAKMPAGTQRLKKLSPKHELFCLELVARGCSRYAEAHKAAGFAGTKQTAWALARDPLIAARVDQLMADKLKKLHMTSDEILARTAMIARADVRGLFDEEGKLRPLHELTDEEAAAVAGVETLEEFQGVGKDRVKVGDVRKVRLRDPMAALRLLAEHKKLVKQPGEGLDALAGSLAARMEARRAAKRAKESKA